MRVGAWAVAGGARRGRGRLQTPRGRRDETKGPKDNSGCRRVRGSRERAEATADGCEQRSGQLNTCICGQSASRQAVSACSVERGFLTKREVDHLHPRPASLHVTVTVTLQAPTPPNDNPLLVCPLCLMCMPSTPRCALFQNPPSLKEIVELQFSRQQAARYTLFPSRTSGLPLAATTTRQTPTSLPCANPPPTSDTLHSR